MGLIPVMGVDSKVFWDYIHVLDNLLMFFSFKDAEYEFLDTWAHNEAHSQGNKNTKVGFLVPTIIKTKHHTYQKQLLMPSLKDFQR